MYGLGRAALSTETRKVQQHRAEERSVSVERYSSTAVSPMRFATVGEKPRLSAVVRAGTSGLGRQRHAGRGNMWPKGGDISVGPYSSTAPPVMRSATMARILSRMRDPP